MPSIVKMSILPEKFYRLTVLLSKITLEIFLELRKKKMILSFT